MFNVKTGDDKLVSGRSIFLQEGHGNLSNGGDIKITGDNTSDWYLFGGKGLYKSGV